MDTMRKIYCEVLGRSIRDIQTTLFSFLLLGGYNNDGVVECPCTVVIICEVSIFMYPGTTVTERRDATSHMLIGHEMSHDSVYCISNSARL